MWHFGLVFQKIPHAFVGSIFNGKFTFLIFMLAFFDGVRVFLDILDLNPFALSFLGQISCNHAVNIRH